MALTSSMVIPDLDPSKVLDRWELSPSGLVLVEYSPTAGGEIPVWGAYSIKKHGPCSKKKLDRRGKFGYADSRTWGFRRRQLLLFGIKSPYWIYTG